MKKLLIFLGFAALVGGAAVPASAHFLKSDRDIGAVLHLDPEDDPIAGQDTPLFFDIKDTAGKFVSDGCNCNVSVSQNGTQLSAVAATPTSTGLSADILFPTKDVYRLTLTGQPIDAGAFQSFSMTWDIRVDRTSADASSSSGGFLSSHFFHLLLILAAVAYLAYRLKIDKRKDDAKKAAAKK